MPTPPCRRAAAGRMTGDGVGRQTAARWPLSPPDRVGCVGCVGSTYKEEKTWPGRTSQFDQFEFRFSGIPEFQDSQGRRHPARHIGFGQEAQCRGFGSTPPTRRRSSRLVAHPPAIGQNRPLDKQSTPILRLSEN